MISLSKIPAGEYCQISAIWGNKELYNTLKSMGITDESQVMVMGKSFGTLIVAVEDKRIAISEDLAKKIMIFQN